MDFALVALAKALASALVLALGFRAVSDDDFSRVVIAEQFALLPRLDPSGTSWLPFPFWLNGAAMLAFGRSLFVARAVAVVLGVASMVLVLFAARRLSASRAGALWGTCLAAVIPWSARLGVATVPELPTAALALFAMSTLVGPDPRGRARLLGGAALLCATLSRYDVWPIALAFSLFCGFDFVTKIGVSSKTNIKISFGAALSLVGPISWIAWNRVSRGNALDFLDRVAAYRRALGEGADGRASRLFAYPAAMVRHEPELFLLLFGLVCLVAVPRLRLVSASSLRPYVRPFSIALFQLAALSAALVKDGAPTHHPERALLVSLLLVAVLVGDLAAASWAAAGPKARLVLCASGLSAVLAGALFARRFVPADEFVPRADEVALGEALRAKVPAGERVLVEVTDYGHFAVTAAFGRPEDVVLDRDLDPRKPKVASSFDAEAALSSKIAEARAAFVVGRARGAALRALGEPLLVQGSLAVVSRRAEGMK